MVSNARDDLPEPEGPVMTVKARRGMSSEIPLRLCCRAPRIRITSFTRRNVLREPRAPRADGGIHITSPGAKRACPAALLRSGRGRQPAAVRLQSRCRTISGGHSIDPEQHDRTDDCQQDAPQREAVESRAGDHVAEETAEKRANDSDQDRDDDAAR